MEGVIYHIKQKFVLYKYYNNYKLWPWNLHVSVNNDKVENR